MSERLEARLLTPACLVSVLFTIVLIILLAGCTFTPDHGRATQDYPDISTPIGLRVPHTAPGMDEYNGGIIDDIRIAGRQYNVVTDALAAKVLKRVGPDGRVIVWYRDSLHFQLVAPRRATGSYRKLTAIDKGVMTAYDGSAL